MFHNQHRIDLNLQEYGFRNFFLLSFLLTLLCPKNIFAQDQPLRIHFLNVGFADCILIESPLKEFLLIDAGPKERVSDVLSYLNSKGIDKIHKGILTHPHKNHLEGFLTILEKLPIEEFYSNGDETRADEGYSLLIKSLNGKGIPIEILKQGSRLFLANGKITMDILNPAHLSGSTNGNSLVIWLRYQQVSFLLTADITPPEQEKLIEIFPAIQSSQCVQIPHHGGETSEKFVEFFKNKVFVISTGPNDYGIPSPKDIGKLKGKTLRTDKEGTIILETDGKRLKMTYDR